jgi:predicted DNA-binding protein
MSANTVRKNFVFQKEVAEHLEAIAKKEDKSMTAIVQELIEKKYDEISVEEKLEALHAFAGSGTGLFGDLTIQQIKANMDV